MDTKALGECLDLFAHRLISLAVRTFGKYRPALLRARRLFRGESTGGFDPCEHVLASLVGFDQGQAEPHLGKERQQLVSLAGPMSRRVPTAVGLRWILATVTGLPLDQVAIEQFVGRWLALSPEDLSRLGGQGRDTGNKLGESVTLGARVWSVDNAACVRFGPLPWGEYIKWLPQAAADLPSRIGRIVRFHVGAVDEISIRPILRGADVKRVQLRGASSGSNAGGQQLGWTTWLVSHDGCESDRDDLAYAIGPGGSPVRRRA